MNDIVFITHRIPFPPDKGDKIRSYHMLRHLAARYRVHLGTFIDDPRDRVYLDDLRPLCASICAMNLNPKAARLRSLVGLLTGEPLTLRYYRNRHLRRWVRRVLKTQPVAAVIAFSSSTGQYVPADPMCGRRIMDFVDVDSAKWQQYARSARWPASVVYAREARKLAEVERQIAQTFDAAIFVSSDEAAFFRQAVAGAGSNVYGLSNGVDSDIFDPAQVMDNPYPERGPVIVFTGMMDYRANAEGVGWFAREIFPHIRRRRPDALFYIVGARPTRAVRALAEEPGIRVTGRVTDVKPFVRHAHVAVAPLKVARGIQNKVLEALAMGTPVIGTPQAFEGIAEFPGRAAMTAASPEAFAAAVVDTMGARDPAQPDATLRRFVQAHYDWDANLGLLDRLIAVPSLSADDETIAEPAAEMRA
ncbi:MAG TPA: TIGR03087 family PEP-CTERM/XrtA system glycosyltransferase [Gammaproteobacteria bacterium]|nr:TIGR03087 family PEP-CTERM/XrtA system glycosyltransferase [Gammaproteobacteria bacterium]